MRLKIHFALAPAALCLGCGYDGANEYLQADRAYGYVPGYSQPIEPYRYPPNYSPYGYAPRYYQQAPSLGLGFGYFGGGRRRYHERDEWHEHQGRGRERQGGFHQPPAAPNVPPPAAHAPPAFFRPTAPPNVSPPPAAAGPQTFFHSTPPPK
jgi:hypothetical protein